MEIEHIIQQWYTLASSGDVSRGDIFFRFVAAWVAFNALYTSRHSDDIGDWDQVRSFAGELDAINRHRQLIDQDQSYQRAIQVLKEKGVGDLRRGYSRRIRNEYNFTEVASCLYQVRCNLFHGGKLPGNPRDERLVAASCEIVSKLSAPFLPTDH